MSTDIQVSALFAPHRTRAWPYLAACKYPWEILPHLKQVILEIGATLDPAIYDHPAEDVWIAKSARLAPQISLGMAIIIGEHTEVRPGAFLRDAVLVGDHCVVGNSCECKNCILFDAAQVPHFNYVGDSVLGYRAHLGAGAVTSNVKGDHTLVTVHDDTVGYETHLKKMGAVLGDGVEVGCHAVLNPGTVIGPYSRIYPLSSVRGVIPSHHIFKSGKGYELVEMQEDR